MAYQPKSYRKFLATSVAAAMVATVAAPLAPTSVEAATPAFSDVVAGQYYTEAVTQMAAAEMINGIGGGKFGTTNELLRRDAAVLFSRSLLWDTEGVAAPAFTDVPTAYYTDAIAKAVELGVITGKTATTFAPNDKLTRGDMAVLLQRALGLTVDASVEVPFTDIEGKYYTEAVKAVYQAGLTTGATATTFNPTGTVTRAQFATFLYRSELVQENVAAEIKRIENEKAGDLKVVSVGNANSAQLAITFNKELDKDTVINSDGTLKAGFLTFSKISGTGTATFTPGSSLASLSSDGKTLLVTVASTTDALVNLTYVVAIAKDVVKAKDGKVLPEFISNTLTAADTVAPTVAGVEMLNASVVRVKFSEPIKSAGNWSFRFADGTTASVSTGTSAELAASLKKGYVDLTIATAVDAGKVITATIIGATDYANNLISPNPVTVNFAKGAKDGVKPTVTDITASGLNKFEVKFSEEIQGLEVSDFTVAGTALTDLTASVAQDATDKTKYTVTLFSPRAAGLATISLAANAVTDLSGETNNAFSRIVEFKADTVAPKLVKSEVKKDNGVEYLHLTFDESVTKTGALASRTATYVKDYVTTSGTLNLTGLTAVAGTSNKEYRVALSAIQFTPNTQGATAISIASGAQVTVSLAGFEDLAENALAATSVTFARSADTDTNKPAVSGITVLDNDTFEVQFDRALDGASATNKFNYAVNGLVVKSATLLPGNKVEVKLEENTNTLSGARSITISGVKSSAGIQMNTHTATETFTENVRPTITKAQLTDINKVTLTFSEAVKNEIADTNDFELLIGGATVAGKATITTPQEISALGSTTLVVTLQANVTPEDLAKGLSVKVLSTVNVKDLNNNVLTATTVTVQ